MFSKKAIVLSHQISLNLFIKSCPMDLKFVNLKQEYKITFMSFILTLTKIVFIVSFVLFCFYLKRPAPVLVVHCYRKGYISYRKGLSSYKRVFDL